MAKSNRSFSPKNIPEKKDDYHGKCRIERVSPALPESVKSANIELTFEEALKLSVAIQSAVLRLNRYNRRGGVGESMGLCLSLKGHDLAIIEQTVKSE